MINSFILFGCFFAAVIALENCTILPQRLKFDGLDDPPDDMFDKPCTTKCVVTSQTTGRPDYKYWFEYSCANEQELKLCTEGFEGKPAPGCPKCPFPRNTGHNATYLDGICCDTDFCTKDARLVDGKLVLLKKEENTKEATTTEIYGNSVSTQLMISSLAFVFFWIYSWTVSGFSL